MTLLITMATWADTGLDTRTRQKFRTAQKFPAARPLKPRPLACRSVPLLTLLLLIPLATTLLLVVTALPTPLLLLVVAALPTTLLLVVATLPTTLLLLLLVVATLPTTLLLLLLVVTTLAGLAAAEAGLLLGVVLALLVTVEAGLLLGVQMLLVAAVLQLLWVHPDLVQQPGVLLRIDLIHPLQLLRSLLVVTAELTDQVQDLTGIKRHEHSSSNGPAQRYAS